MSHHPLECAIPIRVLFVFTQGFLSESVWAERVCVCGQRVCEMCVCMCEMCVWAERVCVCVRYEVCVSGV